MSEPYYQDEHVTLYHGDCREARRVEGCARCDHDIRPGDHIGRDTDGDYLCGRCLP